jgi:hypothetical protein
MSDDDQQRIEELINTIHICSDNGQSMAANNAIYQLGLIIEQNIYHSIIS